MALSSCVDRTILSIPRGPSDVRMASPTAIRECQDRVVCVCVCVCDMARRHVKKVDGCDIYPWRPECCLDAPRWAFPCLGSLSLQEWVWQLQSFGKKEMNAIEV